MSTHKAGGKTRQHVRPVGKRLGVKAFDGQKVKIGSVIVRQRGSEFAAGKGTELGRDHTLFAMTEGVVKFGRKLGKKIIYIANG